jgi:hypothetical protein
MNEHAHRRRTLDSIFMVYLYRLLERDPDHYHVARTTVPDRLRAWFDVVFRSTNRVPLLVYTVRDNLLALSDDKLVDRARSIAKDPELEDEELEHDFEQLAEMAGHRRPAPRRAAKARKTPAARASKRGRGRARPTARRTPPARALETETETPPAPEETE